jgi:uncharacterized peroxidase-related enzyme
MQEVRIAIVQETEATGEVAELYERLRQGFGTPFVPDVFKLASLRPDFLRVLTEGWEAMFLTGTLPRPVKEMIATLVSRINSCQFCTRAHGLLLRSVGGTSEAVAAAESGNVDDLPVEERYRPLLALAVKVTEHAYRVTDDDIQKLRDGGLTDDEILEGVFVASLFNAINRLADTFGLSELLQLREEQTSGSGKRE